MFKITTTALAVAITISGCGLLPQRKAELSPSRETMGLGEISTLPAQLRTITVKKSKASFLSCSEPMPDVALSDTFKLVSDIKAKNIANSTLGSSDSTVNKTQEVGLANDLHVSASALELAGRTQTVLLAREFMFRTCEAAANGWLSDANVHKAHEVVIENITAMIQNDGVKAATEKVRAETAASVSGAALDDKILKAGGSAVRAAIVNACTKSLTQCLAKPSLDEKGQLSCQTSFVDCVK